MFFFTFRSNLYMMLLVFCPKIPQGLESLMFYWLQMQFSVSLSLSPSFSLSCWNILKITWDVKPAYWKWFILSTSHGWGCKPQIDITFSLVKENESLCIAPKWFYLFLFFAFFLEIPLSTSLTIRDLCNKINLVLHYLSLIT